VRRNVFQKCYRLLQQYIPDLKKDILYNLLAMIGQRYNKDVNDGWFRRTETSELTVRTIAEISLEFVPQTFKRYYQDFRLKANQQFVQILPKTYIFQSRSIYNITGKVVWSIKERYDQIYWYVNSSQLYAPANTYFSFDLDKSRRLILKNFMITKLLDSQSFSKVWKSAMRQTFCEIVSKIWPRDIICGPRDIICGPLREHILFAYPTNFTANFEKNLHWLFGVTT